MIVAKKYPFTVSYPYFSAYLTDSALSLKKKYDAVFLSDRADAMTLSSHASSAYFARYENESNASLKVFNEFLYYYSSNQLRTLGWRLGPCMSLKSIRGNDYRGCMLIHI